MKQHIAVFTLGLSLLTSCMTDSAYRKVENGLVADIRSGQAKAVKLEVISDDIIRVIASPDGKFSNQVNLIKDTKSLPAPSFQITTSGDTIIVSTQTTQARLSRETGEVRFTDANGHTILREKTNGGKEFTPIEVEGTKGYKMCIRDRKGNIVVGTSLGVNWINPETGTVTSFNGTKDGRSVFEDQIINVVFCDSRQWVWIGSNHGLHIYDRLNDCLLYTSLFCSEGTHSSV